MFTRSLIKGGGRLATTRSLVNNSTSLVLKINLRNIQHQLLLRLPNQNLRQLVKYSDTLYTAVISVIGSAGLIGYKIYEESQPVDQVKQTPLFPNGEKRKL